MKLRREKDDMQGKGDDKMGDHQSDRFGGDLGNKKKCGEIALPNVKGNNDAALLQLPPATQLGFVFTDLERVVALYENVFSVGKFDRIPSFNRLGYEVTYYKGEPEKFDCEFAFGVFGNVEIEIIKPTSGRSIYRDFLESGREGLHHVGFDVFGDLNERIRAFADIGIGVLQSGKGPNRALAYLDTEKAAGTIIELLERGGPKRLLNTKKALGD